MSGASVSVSVPFDFATAYRANLALMRFLPMTIVITLIFALGGLLVLFIPLSQGHALSAGDVLIATSALLFTPLVTALTLFLARQKNAYAQGPFRYTFSDEGLHIEGPLVSATTKWAAIRRVAETGSFIFLFVAMRKAQCLPKSGIAPGQLAAIRAIIDQHCPPG